MILKKIWAHLEEFVLLPILVFQVGLIFVQVIMRYIFDNSISWSEELARYLFVWLMWFGVSYAARNRTHLRITMIWDRLPGRGAYWLELVITLVWLGFGCFVVFKGVEMVRSILRFKQVSAALGLPMQYAYLGVPLGAGLMDLRLLEILYADYLRPCIRHEIPEAPVKEGQP